MLTGHDRFESFGLFAPHGDGFAYLFPRDGDPNNGYDVIMHSAAGERTLTRALDRNIYRGIWMPSGDALLLGGNDTNYASLWIQPLDGPARRLDLGDVSVRAPYWIGRGRCRRTAASRSLGRPRPIRTKCTTSPRPTRSPSG